MPNQPLPQQPPTATVPNGNAALGIPPKKSFWSRFFRIFLIILVAIIAAVILGAVYVFASMGVIKVPVLSNLVYQSPQATRTVQSESMDNTKIKKSLKSELSRGHEEIPINITEGNLTYILQANYLEDLKIENPQVALINDGSQMEIFGQISGLETDLLAIFDVGLDENGKFITKDLVSLRIGGFAVPKYLIDSGYISEDTVKAISGADLIEKTLSDEGSDLTINKTTIGEGKITEYLSSGSSSEAPVQADDGNSEENSN